MRPRKDLERYYRGSYSIGRRFNTKDFGSTYFPNILWLELKSLTAKTAFKSRFCVVKYCNASVAEMEYALRLGRSSRKGLEVQILSEAQNNLLSFGVGVVLFLLIL